MLYLLQHNKKAATGGNPLRPTLLPKDGTPLANSNILGRRVSAQEDKMNALSPNGEEALPPSAKRGVQTAQALPDWFSITFRAEVGMDAILSLFGGSEDWQPMGYGGKRYQNMMIKGAMRCYFGGNNDTVHLEIPGSALRQLEAEELVTADETDTKKRTWQEHIGLMLAMGGKFTRFDIAIDETGGLLSIDKMEQCCNEGMIASRFRSYERRTGKRSLRNGKAEGDTLYLGDRKSETFLRIYDKAKEQRAKGEEVTGPWVRVELELKRERAQLIAQAIADNGFAAVVPGFLRGYLEFKQRGESKQRERWPIADWWNQFLAAAAKLRLTVKPQEKTLREVEHWFREQIAPTLALLMHYWRGDLDTLYRVSREGEERWRDKHRRLASAIA